MRQICAARHALLRSTRVSKRLSLLCTADMDDKGLQHSAHLSSDSCLRHAFTSHCLRSLRAMLHKSAQSKGAWKPLRMRHAAVTVPVKTFARKMPSIYNCS